MGWASLKGPVVDGKKTLMGSSPTISRIEFIALCEVDCMGSRIYLSNGCMAFSSRIIANKWKIINSNYT